MADSNHTPGYRFVESKFLAKTYKPYLTDRFSINYPPRFSPLIVDSLAEPMETLRLCALINDHAVLRLALPAQKRSRLERNLCLNKSGEIEYLFKEVQWLPVGSAALLQLAEAVALSP